MTANPNTAPEPPAPAAHTAAARVGALAASALQHAATLAADGAPPGATLEDLLHTGAGSVADLDHGTLSPALRRQVETSACAALTFAAVTSNALADAGAEGAYLADTILTRADTVPTDDLVRLLRAAARVCRRAPQL